MGRGEKNGFCVTNGHVEKLPLGAQARGASPQPGLPGDTDRRTHRRCLGRWAVICVLSVLVLTLIVAVAVTAGRREAAPAPVLACPHDWVSHRGVCYYLSVEYRSLEQGQERCSVLGACNGLLAEYRSWEQGREQCSALGASLAVLREEWELEFLSRLSGDYDCWLGMRHQGQGWEWVDGSSVNDTFKILGHEPCVHLADSVLVSASCSQLRPFLCSKPQAPVCGD